MASARYLVGVDGELSDLKGEQCHHNGAQGYGGWLEMSRALIHASHLEDLSKGARGMKIDIYRRIEFGRKGFIVQLQGVSLNQNDFFELFPIELDLFDLLLML